jgi:hypothetical protein
VFEVIQELGGINVKQKDVIKIIKERHPCLYSSRYTSNAIRRLKNKGYITEDYSTRTFTILEQYPELITVATPITEEDVIPQE